MTPCLSHNFPPMYLKRNTTTRLLNLRTLLCMQLLTYETAFEYIFWPIRRTVRRVHCKKGHNFTHRLTYRDHARVQIFTYKDVSVYNVSSPNFHMFLWQASCFHANISTLSCSCTSSHTKRHGLCETLNISHLVCHIISHRCSRNKVQHHNFF